VYQVESTRGLPRGRRRLLRQGGRWPRVSRTVLLLGLTSLFTDISSEMVSTILPLYLVFGLGLSPLQFGVVDGLYQGVAAVVRVAGGFAADRWRRHKEVAAVGYGISAFCKLGFVLVGNALSGIGGIVVMDRIGKGIRTAPRDALISLSSMSSNLATSFGVHRAFDTAGAMLGPLVAFGLLALTPRAFDSVFVVSFCVALVGLSILVLFVERQPVRPQAAGTSRAAPAENSAAPGTVSVRDAVGLLGARNFQGLMVIGAALALFTMSDGFLYLALQRHLEFDERFLPLLFTGSALTYMLLAVPVGQLADRVGRGRVFLGGYALLLPVYASLLVPAVGIAALPACLLLIGCYYAATDGVLMAFASTLMPQRLLGSGLALLVTATSLMRLLASVILGALWTWYGLDTAVLAFGIGLLVAMLFSATVLGRLKQQGAYA
jgi:hypothetical protein